MVYPELIRMVYVNAARTMLWFGKLMFFWGLIWFLTETIKFRNVCEKLNKIVYNYKMDLKTYVFSLMFGATFIVGYWRFINQSRLHSFVWFLFYLLWAMIGVLFVWGNPD